MSSVNPSDSISARLLPKPLQATAKHDFFGEEALGELTFKKGDSLLIWCLDMSAGWVLAELITHSSQNLTIGLIPKGFYIVSAEQSVGSPCMDSLANIMPQLLSVTPDDTVTTKEDTLREDEVAQPLSQLKIPESLSTSAGNSEVKAKAASSSIESPVQLTESPQIDSWQEVELIHRLDTSTLSTPDSPIKLTSSISSTSILSVSTASSYIGNSKLSPCPDGGPSPIASEHFIDTAPEHIFSPPTALLSPDTNATLLATVTNTAQPTIKASKQHRRRGGAFASTGAEDFLIGPAKSWLSFMQSQATESDPTIAQANPDDAWYIEAGPSWKPKSPPFKISIGSPQTIAEASKPTYSSFPVTSIFNDEKPQATSYELHVQRRFSHFALLAQILQLSFPAITMLNLPEQRLRNRFEPTFLENRRLDLERWLLSIVQHPVLRFSEALMLFCSYEDGHRIEHKLTLLLHQANIQPTYKLFEKVYFPDFNLDEQDAAIEIETFSDYLADSAKSKRVQQVEAHIDSWRHGYLDGAKQISHLAVAIDKAFGTPEDICWRSDCESCHISSQKAVEVSKMLGDESQIQQAHAQNTLLGIHARVRELAYPAYRYAKLKEASQTAHSALKDVQRGDVATEEPDKLDTILNLFTAEIDHAHSTRAEDISKLMEDTIAAQMAFHEAALQRLHKAKEQLKAITNRQAVVYRPVAQTSTVHTILKTPSTFSTPAETSSIRDSTILAPFTSVFQTFSQLLDVNKRTASAAIRASRLTDNDGSDLSLDIDL